MCLAVPGQITESTDGFGVVEFGGIKRRISLAFVPGAACGDWVLVHAGFAIQVLSDDEAASQLELIREVLGAEDVEDDGVPPGSQA